MEMEEVLQATQEGSDSVGLLKFVEELMGAAMQSAETIPVVGPAVTGTLGAIALPFQRASSTVFDVGQGVAGGESLENLLKRAGRSLAGEKITRAADLLKSLGYEDPTGIAPFVLETAVDTVTGAGLSKVVAPLASKAVRAGVEKLAPTMKAERLAREAGTAAGYDLSTVDALKARRLERTLLPPIDEPLATAEVEQRALARAHTRQAQELGGMAAQKRANLLNPLSAFDTEETIRAADELSAAQAESLRRAKLAREQAKSIRNSRPGQLEGFLAKLGTKDELEKFYTEGQIKPEQASDIRYSTRGELKAQGITRKINPLNPQPILFSGKVVDGLKEVFDPTKGVTLSLSRKSLPDPKTAAFFLGRWAPAVNVFRKLGLLEPYVNAQMAYYGEYEAAIRDMRVKAQSLGILDNAEARKRVGMGLEDPAVRATWTPQEAELGRYWRERTDSLLDRLNVPDDARRENYFTHMREHAHLWSEGFGKEYLGDDIPRYVTDPYLMKRTDQTVPRSYDALEAFQVYQRMGLRKLHFDPVLAETSPFIKKLPERLRHDVEGTVGLLLGRPSMTDRLIQKGIADYTGQTLNIGRASRIAAGINNWFYRGLIGGNFGTALSQITQSMNTASEFGLARTLKAAWQFATNTGSLSRAEIRKYLQRGFTESFRDPIAFEGAKEGKYLTLPRKLALARAGGFVDKVLFAPATFADLFSRGTAFLAGFDEARSRGFSMDFAIRQGARAERETQFIYGALGRNQFAQSGILSPLAAFSQYPVNQINFLLRQIRGGKFEPFFNYVLSAGYLSKVASNFGLDLQSVESPLSFQEVGKYLTLQSQPVMRGLRAILALGDVETKEDAQQWSTRMVEAFKTLIPIVHRANVVPGAAQVADFSTVDRMGNFALRNPQGLVTSYRSKGRQLGRILGFRSLQERQEREENQRIYSESQSYVDTKRDLERSLVDSLKTGEDPWGYISSWVQLTGGSLGELVEAVKRRESTDVTSKLERLWSDLPAAMKIRHADRMLREIERNFPEVNETGVPDLVQQLQGGIR